MGKKKKSSRKPVKRVVRKLDTQFTCLFCNHEKAVSCTLDKKLGVGFLHCKICGQNFQTPINALSAAVDVYSDWIDACEALAQEESGGGNAGRQGDEDGDGEETGQASPSNSFVDNDEDEDAEDYDD